MNTTSFHDLINNAALLLALGLVYDLLALRQWTQRLYLQRLLTGVALGSIGLAVMFNPWTLAPGVVFDTRSVLLGVSGLFFGTVPTLVAMLMTAALRLYQGGAGALTGTTVILVSGTIGIAWRWIRYKNRSDLQDVSPGELYIFGVLVHIAMLLCMLLLPGPLPMQVLSQITLPVMVIYPVAVMLLGVLLASRLKREQVQLALRASEARYRTTLTSVGDAVIAVDAAGQVEFLNPVAEALSGWQQADALGRPLADVFKIINEDTRQPVESPVAVVLRSGGVVGLANHTLLVSRDGSEHPIAHSGAPIHNDNNEILGVVLVFRDQSQERAAMRAVQESERRFSTVFHASPTGICITRLADGRFVDVNQAFLALVEYTLGEVIGYTAHELKLYVRPDERDLIVATLRKEGKVKDFETQLRTKSGSVHEVLFSPQLIEIGGETYILSLIHDITERKKTEETLRANRENLAALIENTDDSIWSIDTQYRLIVGNSLLLRNISHALGREIKSEESVLLPTFPPEALDEWRGYYDRTLRGERFSVETQTRFTDRPRFVEYRFNPIMAANGQVSGATVMGRDVTQRKQDEEHLRRSESALQKAQQVAHVGSWAWHIQENRIEWSDEMYHIFGVSKEGFTGDLDEVIALAIHPQDRAVVEASNLSVVEKKKPIPLEYRVIWPDQSVHTVWAEAGELTLDAAGNPAILTGIVMDITERKRSELQIKDALHEKEVLLRELNHRTKNNMQVIRAMLVLQSANSESEEVKQLVQATDNKIQAMALVHQMLYQSKNLSSIDLQIYITDLAYLMLGSFQFTPDQIELRLDLQPVQVSLDIATPLGLILNELLSNAFKHAFPNGRRGMIQVSLSRAIEGVIHLGFVDDGVGVPPGFDLRNQPSYGLQSVFSLAEQQLGGKVQVGPHLPVDENGAEPHGLSYSIEFPDSVYLQQV